jgi:hypothetical protein
VVQAWSRCRSTRAAATIFPIPPRVEAGIRTTADNGRFFTVEELIRKAQSVQATAVGAGGAIIELGGR